MRYVSIIRSCPVPWLPPADKRGDVTFRPLLSSPDELACVSGTGHSLPNHRASGSGSVLGGGDRLA